MDKTWKKKALSLALMTTVTVGAPTVLLGCESTPKVNEVATEDKQDDAYHGTGQEPFVFPETDKSKSALREDEVVSHYTYVNYRSLGWTAWQGAKDNTNITSSEEGKSKGYSSFIRSSVGA